MQNNTTTEASFRLRCKEHKLSITPQRLAIYNMVSESRKHPNTEEVYKQIKKTFPDISLDTVYRTLCLFAEIGLIAVVEGFGNAKKYDSDLSPHHHFHCRRCGRIIDFVDAELDRITPPAKIAEQCTVQGVRVVVEGLCGKCRGKADKSKAKAAAKADANIDA